MRPSSKQVHQLLTAMLGESGAAAIEKSLAKSTSDFLVAAVAARASLAWLNAQAETMKKGETSSVQFGDTKVSLSRTEEFRAVLVKGSDVKEFGFESVEKASALVEAMVSATGIQVGTLSKNDIVSAATLPVLGQLISAFATKEVDKSRVESVLKKEKVVKGDEQKVEESKTPEEIGEEQEKRKENDKSKKGQAWTLKELDKLRLRSSFEKQEKKPMAKAKIFDMKGKQLADLPSKQTPRESKVVDHPSLDQQGTKMIKPDLNRWEKMRDAKKAAGKPAAKASSALQPGDVFEYNEKGRKGHGRVITSDRHGRSDHFYYHNSDPKGNFRPDDSDPQPWSSNMLLGASKRKVGHNPVEARSHKAGDQTYVYHKTGHPSIDSRMANLDGRSSIFQDLASPQLQAKYARNEDKNFHSENAAMVDRFADHVTSGNPPETFGAKKKPAKKAEMDKADQYDAQLRQKGVHHGVPDRKNAGTAHSYSTSMKGHANKGNSVVSKQLSRENLKDLKSMKAPNLPKSEMAKAKIDDGLSPRAKTNFRSERNKSMWPGSLKQRLMAGVHKPAFGSADPGTSNMGAHLNDDVRKQHSRRNLKELKAMPTPKLPKSEMEKAGELPGGAGIPKMPKMPKPQLKPVMPSNAPKAAAAKQAQASASGKQMQPKKQKPISNNMAMKSESFHVTEEEAFQACEQCGIPEFKKSEAGPVFSPCACFMVGGKKFASLTKNDKGYSLKFGSDADPESKRAFLLMLKLGLLAKKITR